MKLSRVTWTIVLAICVVGSRSLPAQAPAAPAFEVASVKPLPPMETLTQEIASGKRSFEMLLGPTVSGARFDGMASLTDLITRAYNVQPLRMIGPEWMRSQLFEIHAKIPESASKDQVPQMLQNLLSERFKLMTHWEKKEQPVYALIVSKGGHKLKEAASTESPAKTATEKAGSGEGEKRTIVAPFGRIQIDPSSGSTGSSERTGQVRSITETGLLIKYAKTTMSELAETVTQYVDRPVIDMTGLKGSYQVSLEISRAEQSNMMRRLMPNAPLNSGSLTGPSGSPPASGLAGVTASDPSGTGISRSLQQMGLKLDSRKEPVDMLVIDRIDKNPTSD